ncbi:MAG: hypothetical protein KKD18_05840 [Nanoarchaeota archaeon]|nr:hypothetical protein [Nanoarchaeota archaeon]MBU0977912.1 hypothetical protein [Nanoarchaeota archaeon]
MNKQDILTSLATLIIGTSPLVNSGCTRNDKVYVSFAEYYKNRGSKAGYDKNRGIEGGTTGKNEDTLLVSEDGFVNYFPYNEAIDLNGDGRIQGHEFLGGNGGSFYPNENISFYISAARSRGDIKFALISPDGTTITQGNLPRSHEETVFTYTLKDSEKTPGWYTLNLSSHGEDLFDSATIIRTGGKSKQFFDNRVFEIKP